MKYRARHKIGQVLGRKGIRGFVYHYCVRGAFEEVHPNVSHEHEAIFIHIPKTAGTSVKNLVGLTPGMTMHTKPTNMVHKKTWKQYTSFTIVRNPLDRFFSNYFFHTSPKYEGGLTSICPGLKEMGVREYFYRLKEVDSNHIDPQHEFITHKYSSKILDHILKLDNIKNDIKKICNIFGIKNCTMPRKNSSGKYKHKVQIEEETLEDIINYYQKDFDLFGYRIKDSKSLCKYIKVKK
nr:sulfotransferase family 2 domain-containing protein [Salinibacter ruber]